ncbi:FAR1-related sequence 5-like protein, partial [Tanacetum coccineum]
YNMVFVPFTGADNHRKCVTLGSGMLLHEDTKSYTWLLKAFKTAFLKEPTMIVTYQDRFLVDDCLFLLNKNKVKLGVFVEKLKIIKDEVKADVPNPPSRNTGDVIGDIFSISKPTQIDVQNPTKARNKGEHLKKGERLKSEREKALKLRAKPMKVCGYCNLKTNEQTKTTCPKITKAKRKKKATPIIDV